MRVRDLGPIDAVIDGQPHLIPGLFPQTLLRVLARNPGHSVSLPALIDALWGNDPPGRAAALLEQHVWRLRKILEPGRRAGQPAQILVHTSAGYALRIDPSDVDSLRQEQLVRSGRKLLAAGRAEDALDQFATAAALWRGPPVSRADDPWRTSAEDVRIGALEGAADAELALDRPAEALARLDAVSSEWPLHEGLCERRMLALYRLGRQADALAAYRDVRNRLANELGGGSWAEAADSAGADPGA
jgi:DNA-binding SARP family transcriptional activator